jgi:hypothetical protein
MFAGIYNKGHWRSGRKKMVGTLAFGEERKWSGTLAFETKKKNIGTQTLERKRIGRDS